MAGRSGSNSTCENFEAFFNGWLIRQENFLQQLVQAPSSNNERGMEQLRSLIKQVLSHYEQYLQEKARAAQQEVLLFYSPPWLTSFEKTLLWTGGFKPFLLFNLLSKSVTELTAEQQQILERLKYETRREEQELTEAMAVIQESLATPPLLELGRRSGRLIDCEVVEFESEMEKLKEGMLRTLERADKLRGSTVKKVIEILSPAQTVKFLANAAELQLSIRKQGLNIDRQRETSCILL